MPLNANPEETTQRDAVIKSLRDAITVNGPVKLPAFTGASPEHRADFALHTIGLEQSQFSGFVGGYSYVFEGEEDLLHLFITRLDRERLTPEESREVVAFLLPELPPALIWLKPGEYSQHFYMGQEELLR